MSDRISKIKVGSYVKLKNGFDNTDFYKGVTAGATGWVTDSKVDSDGFALIYVEWDELNNNWAGERDKWVFESHFSVLQDHEMDLDVNEEYIARLRVATDAALSGDGFILITASKIDGFKNSYISQVYGSELDPNVIEALDKAILAVARLIKSKKEYRNMDMNEDDNESRW
jgi:hypothetical protein